MAECNGICLTPADIGLPEYNHVGVAYAHPDCEEHGDPLEYQVEEDTCGGGDESLRYVRAQDMEHYFLTWGCTLGADHEGPCSYEWAEE